MKKTIVLYPTPDMGHIISMVELGKLILHHYTNKFSIIILQTTGFRDGPQLHSYIQLISQSYPSITFHRFPFQYVDTSPTRSPAAICFEFIRLNAPNVHQALQELLKSHTICAFIIDLFCTSALSLGKDLKIPTYYFFTSGSTVLGSFLYFPILHNKVTKSFKDLKNEIIQFPGMPPLKATELPEPMPDRDDPAYWDMLYFCLNLPKSDGIIVNTFNGLEPSAVKAITDGVCVPDSKTPPMFTIGPLIKEEEEEEEEEKGSNEDCLSWLDQQPKQSVVYLCFGSRGSLSTLQVKEIANGLEKSGQRFLWVVKKPPSVEKMKQIENLVDFDLESILPYGFLERTKELGKVVKCWVPQVAVLKKESIGGFVTHCGWNSVLESVVAGVPMIAWPLYAEQHMNRNFLVNGLKLAIAVEQREGDEFVSGAELEKRVNELIGSKSGSEIREKIWKMKEMALVAWGVCGSSSVSLAEFVEAICK